LTPDSNDYPPVKYRTRLVDEVNQIGGIQMDHMITVQLADKTGHTQMLLSPADTVETIQQNSGAWVYADNQLIQADQVNEDNLSTVSSVRILPGLVGG
jgi:predicted SAM-dependent methyltransferase